ncbi:YeeE/YedE family protein [bacterium]|nr:YeeE/YedE family protein [bacterium]NUN45073.1 YeeE/YedE family protein [bacterium]
MNAPFLKFDMIGFEQSLIIAVFIGIGFGFFLEQAGFGSAVKLAQQFYLNDLSVFKVMFSALVTAMLGLFWLNKLDLLDLSAIRVLPTYIYPQLAGGVVFGVGFIMGGYCPGTCCVASVTGRMDGWIHFIGMMTGIFIFAEAYPYIESWYFSTSLGDITLFQFFQIPYGTAVFIVVMMALLGFVAAERIEKLHAKG